ncbi:MAG: pyrroline-5-carboxylate reductase [Syntrophomonadaceae bacterium]|jgi:pyrroline-5-carboxylate reductase|nr:pyrroline-5-carboxylate reductase [Syntrophomonadaceae bacterium]
MKGRKVLGIIGCGQMASALVAGLSKAGHAFERVIGFDIDRSRLELLGRDFALEGMASNREVAVQADLMVLAVKPDQVGTILNEIHDSLQGDELLVSIAAGITTDMLENSVGKELGVVRVMPNTPCLIGEGATAVAGGQFASADDRELVVKMFSTMGTAVLVPETYLDAVTAVSGSGPAYIYLVAEAMIDAGVDVGLPRALARSLVLQTMKGSVAMLEESGQHPAVLKDQVTSPGGTTIAGVRELEGNGLRRAFFRAVRQAWERSIELGKK